MYTPLAGIMMHDPSQALLPIGVDATAATPGAHVRMYSRLAAMV
jgi:hypothetical protein